MKHLVNLFQKQQLWLDFTHNNNNGIMSKMFVFCVYFIDNEEYLDI